MLGIGRGVVTPRKRNKTLEIFQMLLKISKTKARETNTKNNLVQNDLAPM